MAVPTLKSANLTLRHALPEDVERRFALGPEDDSILRMYGVQPEQAPPFTREHAERWVKALIDHPYAWIIEHHFLIGAVRLDWVDLHDRQASLAIGLLHTDHLGKGFGTEAARSVLQFAFSDLKLHRVALRVLAANTRAIRSYEKCGFKVEGRERETVFVDGVWQDDLIMGLLDHEFLAEIRVP